MCYRLWGAYLNLTSCVQVSYEFEEEYYLVLNRMGSGKKRLLAEAVLDEYGEIVATTGVFLSEHGKTIIPVKAVQTLNASFNKPSQS